MEEPTGVLGTPGCFGVQVQNPLPVTPSPVLGKTEHFWGTFSSAATPQTRHFPPGFVLRPWSSAAAAVWEFSALPSLFLGSSSRT